jgi:hypothetical protein
MPRLVLLGDSVFDNSAYVPFGRDVLSQLIGTLPSSWSVDLLAEDGATTADVERQVRSIPREASHLLLSIGGNDALLRADLLVTPVTSTAEAFELLHAAVAQFKSDYQRALQRCLRLSIPTTVCTIYGGSFEDKRSSQAITTALAVFNDAIVRTAIESSVPILDLRFICEAPGDFTNSIEPSAVGSIKIAQAISRVTSEGFGRTGARFFV